MRNNVGLSSSLGFGLAARRSWFFILPVQVDKAKAPAPGLALAPSTNGLQAAKQRGRCMAAKTPPSLVRGGGKSCSRTREPAVRPSATVVLVGPSTAWTVVISLSSFG
jgi:hypothetical protein